MKIKKEIIDCTYEITEINKKDFDVLKLAFRRAMDYYWQYGTYHHCAINGTPLKGEMDSIELLANKMLSE